MAVWRSRNPPYPLIALLIVLAVCLLLYHSSKPIEGIDRTRLVKAQSNSESRKLVQVLSRASMIDRTVILTMVNQAWASPGSILGLFLESFRIGQGTERLLNHLLIISVDDQAFQYCKSVHPHCFHLQTSRKKFGIGKPFMNPNHLEYSWKRNELLREVLTLGYNVVFTDAEVMWFRNPILHFNPLSEINIGCDPQRRSNNEDGGFFYAKSNAISIEFFKYQKMARILYPNSHSLSFCEISKSDRIIVMFGMSIKYLDTAYFGSFCWPSTDMSKVHTMRASCCNDTESKVHDLKLVLDDWRNYTARSVESVSLGGSSPSWRAPNKCKRGGVYVPINSVFPSEGFDSQDI